VLYRMSFYYFAVANRILHSVVINELFLCWTLFKHRG